MVEDLSRRAVSDMSPRPRAITGGVDGRLTQRFKAWSAVSVELGMMTVRETYPIKDGAHAAVP